ncbi:MAG: phage tail protein [Flavobacteriales bacterium]|nr:phage tail protein [Flavobacteriales bacterium]
MIEIYYGQILYFAGNFAPRNYAFCEGQLLEISQNQALFSLLGTQFGGDGRTTFGLPDLRGRTSISFGRGPGLDDFRMGERGSAETVTLTSINLPSHTHALQASTTLATTTDPDGQVLAQGSSNMYVNSDPTTNKVMAPESIGATGGGQQSSILEKTLCIYAIIAMQGLYPSRN